MFSVFSTCSFEIIARRQRVLCVLAVKCKCSMSLPRGALGWSVTIPGHSHLMFSHIAPHLNHTTLRKADIACNFGLSDCNRVT